MCRKLILSFWAAAFSGSLFANCDKPVTPLKLKQEAPCEGYLFSPEKELELRLRNEEYKLLIQQTEIYIKQKELYKKELEYSEQARIKEGEKAELWRKLAEESTLKYVELRETSSRKELYYLVGGVIITVAAGYAIGQASK